MRDVKVLEHNWLFRKGDIADFYLGSFPIQGIDDWQKVSVPHDWAIAGQFDGWNEPLMTVENNAVSLEPGNSTGALPYAGIGVYICLLEFSEAQRGKVLQLEFDGVMSRSQIFVNGKTAGDALMDIPLLPWILQTWSNLTVLRMFWLSRSKIRATLPAGIPEPVFSAKYVCLLLNRSICRFREYIFKQPHLISSEKPQFSKFLPTA